MTLRFIQQCNAKLHAARTVQNFFGANNVNILSWSACLPDMSSIEHLWDVMNCCVPKHPHPPANQQKADTGRASMRQRVFATRDGHTSY